MSDYDPYKDLIESNQESTIRVYREAVRLARAAIADGNHALADKILAAASAFHPMHEWGGFPGEDAT